LSNDFQFKDVIKPAVLFTTDLVGALDTRPIPDGADEAIASFLACVAPVFLDNNKRPSPLSQCNENHRFG
jgi:hypothetical protein